MSEFSETQRFVGSTWVLIGAVIGAVTCAAMPYLLMSAEDGASMAGTISGAAAILALLLLFTNVKLVTRVDVAGLHVKVSPLMRTRVIAFGEIRHCWARSYRPIREYGGWGIRGLGRNRAYNIMGHEGVQLILADGKKILVGSQRAGELAVAIRATAQATGHDLLGDPV